MTTLGTEHLCSGCNRDRSLGERLGTTRREDEEYALDEYRSIHVEGSAETDAWERS